MITELIARIKATVPAIKLVGGSADFQSAAEKNPTVTPSCFVYAVEEMPGPNQLANVVAQTVHCQIAVCFVVRNLSDNKGVAAQVDLDALRLQVKEQIYGWPPTLEHDPLERGASHLLAFRDGHLWWQDIYTTSYLDRSVL